jgi:hypothetical protein
MPKRLLGFSSEYNGFLGTRERNSGMNLRKRWRGRIVVMLENGAGLMRTKIGDRDTNRNKKLPSEGLVHFIPTPVRSLENPSSDEKHSEILGSRRSSSSRSLLLLPR